ncbi:uncharacterized protein CDV56_101464 [Aspergillus thermomutatus]|uniref:Uncharacterized protein n=1 Tax=Aspergillus thermomutatus TaxID=41047 RepID=A0A397GW25_ASPTH|nr:uncharacterized protein CDV56_101464 [Aspergillus thermomutatus]RHZ54837.1 hypothetical protein CDV56_101464 [Aspergillus thermomutatus]
MDPLTIAVEKWERNIQKAKSPKDYLPFLLSDLEFVEKARILYKVATQKGLPDHLFEHPDGAEKIGCQLQRAGQSDLTRLLWYFQFHQKKPSENVMGWCAAMILYDSLSRWLVQRDIREREKLRSKQKELQLCTSPEERAELESAIDKIEEGFKDDADLFQELYRDLWQLQEHMPSGPLRRAFLAWRSTPDWYLCDWLRRECASRGGCCGRSCGCCEKPRDTERVLNRGHCTPARSCCAQTHGETDDAFEEKLDELETFFVEKDNMYARRLCRAYIWGTDVLNEIEDEEEFNWEAWLHANKGRRVEKEMEAVVTFTAD